MSAPHIAIIGAGPSGLAAAKNCRQAGFTTTVFEKNQDVGGNWLFDARDGHSSVYENTHIISSKAWSEYEDFPMPADYPDYPSHRQLQAYFAAYADHFELRPSIHFGHMVIHACPSAGGWSLKIQDPRGEIREEIFSHLMVCNGHHWDPRLPEYSGEFHGRMLHSHDFKRADDSWRGQRVLIIGAGNSACDVAVELSRVTQEVYLSTRTPQWFIPKFIFGKPADQLATGFHWLPSSLRQKLLQFLLERLQGRNDAYGLPHPSWSPFQAHPTINQDLLPLMRHGRIQARPAIAHLDGDGVVFSDGRREAFDVIVAATGYWIRFPFFDSELVDFSQVDQVPLWHKMIPMDLPNLYFIGLFQPLGCIWPLADYQALLACREIAGLWQRPTNMAEAIRQQLARPHYAWRNSPRHATEVDYHQFRRDLVAELARAGVQVGPPPRGRAGHYQPVQKINWNSANQAQTAS